MASSDKVCESGATVALCKIHPRFMHTNSTSHVWIFGAFAELMDNARDSRSSVHVDISSKSRSYAGKGKSPSTSRRQVSKNQIVCGSKSFINSPSTSIKSPISSRDLILQIGTSQQDSKQCLAFTDNGRGMNEKALLDMLSFGYAQENSDDMSKIGKYGNGFKSGSMRIGKDVIVLTICDESWCIGMLSQTYHEKIGADQIFIPIVTFDKNTKRPINDKNPNLDAITQYSIFKSLEEVVKEFNDIQLNVETGTRIIIYNIAEGQLDFETDENDIINCQTDAWTTEMTYRRSLREYCSILYKPDSQRLFSVNIPEMKIYLRDKLVAPKSMTKLLRRKVPVVCKHNGYDKEIVFGYIPDEELDYGMMLYHRNRLIKYEKVGYQKKINIMDKEMRIVGIVDVDNILEPNQTKQDFNQNDSYKTVMAVFGTKLNNYCDKKDLKRKKEVQNIDTKQRKLPENWKISRPTMSMPSTQNLNVEHDSPEVEQDRNPSSVEESDNKIDPEPSRPSPSCPVVPRKTRKPTRNISQPEVTRDEALPDMVIDDGTTESPTRRELTILRENVQKLLTLHHPTYITNWHRHIGYDELADIDQIVLNIIQGDKPITRSKRK